MGFNEKLQELRKEKGMTQEELAEVLFVSRTAISKWESGRGYPNIESLKAIAKYFSVTVDELLSSDQLLRVSEEDKKQTAKSFRDTAIGIIDISSVMLIILPLFAVAFGFAILGLVQWIRRKSILAVDRSVLILGGFYAVVIAFYLLFEVVSVNYRPVLIDGVLEASYPSSTTMLVMCVMPTAIMQLRSRIKFRRIRIAVSCAIAGFTAFMVVGRFVSGVHWLSDIIGGVLLSGGLVTLYRALVTLLDREKE